MGAERWSSYHRSFSFKTLSQNWKLVISFFALHGVGGVHGLHLSSEAVKVVDTLNGVQVSILTF